MSVDHYDDLLADVYDWMSGGWELNVQKQREVLRDLDVRPRSHGAVAIDLGAGTGYQSVPLAELGFDVLAIEPSARMRAQLEERTIDHDISVSVQPLDQHPVTAEVICCMGDTLAHFESVDHLDGFFHDAASQLTPSGRLVLSYRDNSHPPTGDGRFFAVRSDADRIITCFVETVGDRLRIHDVLHLRNGDHFDQRISSYDKLRLDRTGVDDMLREHGFAIERTTEAGGLVTTVAAFDDHDPSDRTEEAP